MDWVYQISMGIMNTIPKLVHERVGFGSFPFGTHVKL